MLVRGDHTQGDIPIPLNVEIEFMADGWKQYRTGRLTHEPGSGRLFYYANHHLWTFTSAPFGKIRIGAAVYMIRSSGPDSGMFQIG